MKEEKTTNILRRVGHDAGMTVPDGYFQAFASRMEALIDEQPQAAGAGADAAAPAPIRPTRWQQVRAYVYMAAMFAGVWLMLNMFSFFAPMAPERELASHPVLSEALQDPDFVAEEVEVYDIPDEYALLEALYDDGVSVESLRAEALM